MSMDPPPLPAPPLAAVSSAAHLPHNDSIESSPRSRKTDSFDDSLAHVPGAPKLRLVCSCGGHIVPRPHDKSLCYVGGETRMVVLDRNVSLACLSARVAKTLLLQAKPFCLKYQLPNEDLDSLISLAGDEDLDNMIEEYDRILAAAGAGVKGSRLRLFVFPAKSESIASIGSLLDSSVKSDEWFLSVLNGSGVLNGGLSDSASVNCLLGLESHVVVNSSNDLGVSTGLDSEFVNGGKNVKILNQDVHSVPDSPLMETTSSFGSATSTPPSLANLPPVRVRDDDARKMRPQDQRLGIEEQFVQTSLSVPPAAENFTAMSSPTTVVASMPVQTTVTSSAPGTSSALAVGDFQNRVVSDDERSDHSGMLGHGRKSPQPQPVVQQQQRSGGGADLPKPDSFQNRVVSDDERSDHSGMLGHGRKSPQPQSVVQQQQQQQQQQQMQQRPGGGADSLKPDSFPSDGSILNATPQSNQLGSQEVIQVSSGENKISANLGDQRNNFIDLNNAPVPLQKHVQGSGYMVQPQMEPQHYPYPPQFVHAGAHYVSQQPGNSMAMPAYYPFYVPPQQQIQHPHHQPIQLQPQQYQRPVYIVQAPLPPQGYNVSMQQHTYPESAAVVHTGQLQTPLNPNGHSDSAKAFSTNPNVARAPNPEMPSAIYRTNSVADAQPLVPAAPNLAQQQYVSYSQVSHQPQVTSAPNPTYSYEIPDPARAQIYYTQPLGPSLISQYQTMSSGQVMEAASTQPLPQNDSMKPSQIKTA